MAGDMVLLAFDEEGGRLPVRQSLAPAVRGALLAELLDGGALTDEAGAAGVAGEAPADAALRHVWQGIAADPGRKWLHWVRRDGRESVRQVLRALEKDGLVRQSTSRVFGFLPLDRARLTPAGLAAARDVRASVAATAEATAAGAGGAPAAGRTALLTGLAHAGGQLGVALPADRRRVLKGRLTDLAEDAAPVSAAVRRAVQDLGGAAVS
ncbi:GOLPH3/VPS74 family protein [Streptomyces lavendofoliae]|nr:GPP34 family phosphoprotein [Streptomyces lavendofoliae]